MKQKFISAIAHVAAWLLFFSLVLGFVYKGPGSLEMKGGILSLPFLLFSFVYLFLFYFNAGVLIPHLYLKKKYFAYVTVVLILFAGAYSVRPFDNLMKHLSSGQRQSWQRMMERLPADSLRRDAPAPAAGPDGRTAEWPGPPGERGPGGHGRETHRTDIVSVILFITVWSLSTAICVIREWRRTESRMVQAQADRAKAELSFLKAQINPHFLFNTLNNIYSLAITNNEHTAESIMKLSNIMRYVTDEIGEDFVPLENEIECLRDYIDLQKLRLGKKMKVEFLVQGIVSGKKIAPLILMNFIENVFKYGISSHEPSDILIRLTVLDDNMVFFCQNKLFESKQSSGRSGIGLENTRLRLQRLYPNKHLLNITKENGFYTVQLIMQT